MSAEADKGGQYQGVERHLVGLPVCLAEQSAQGRRFPDVRMEAPRDPGVAWNDIFGMGHVWWPFMCLMELLPLLSTHQHFRRSQCR